MLRNTRDTFEKEGQAFDHILSMYEDSKGFEHYWQNRRKDLVLEEMKRLIGRKRLGSFLDLGCAEGLYARKASDFGCKNVVGLDISRWKLVRAVKHLPKTADRPQYVLGSAEALPFKDESFELVLLSSVLEMVPQEKACLKEVYRVCKEHLVLTVPSVHSTIFEGLRLLLKPEVATTIYAYTKRPERRGYALNPLCREFSSNWRIVKAFGIAPFAFLILPLFGSSFKSRLDWIQKFQRLDDVLENKFLFRFLGNYILLSSSRLPRLPDKKSFTK